MSAWHDPDRTVVDAFLENRSSGREADRPIAGSFAASKMLPAASGGGPADARGLAEGHGKRWRLSTLLNQVCIVDRFLDHLVEIGLIANNPIALAPSVQRQTNKPIWRALASPIPTRPWPRCDGLRPSAACWGLHARPCRADAQPGISI
jgi:hypothetical protein